MQTMRNLQGTQCSTECPFRQIVPLLLSQYPTKIRPSVRIHIVAVPIEVNYGAFMLGGYFPPRF
jgi:hypothetical protein